MERSNLRSRRIAVGFSALLFGLAFLVLVALPGAVRVHAGGLPSLAPSGVNPLSLNPFQVATLHWGTIRSTTFPTGQFPGDLVFDGASVWVSYQGNQNSGLIKIRASDGARLGKFPVGALAPTGMVFDGANIWVSDGFTGKIAKIRASDGNLLGWFEDGFSGGSILYMTFDGKSLWLADGNFDQLVKMRPSDAKVLATYPYDFGPLAFDGVDLWLASSTGVLQKIRTSDGSLVSSTPLTNMPNQMTFDGAVMWIGDFYGGTVIRVRASDLAVLGTITLVSHPNGFAFDGSNMWISNDGADTVEKFAVEDGSLLDTFTTGSGPTGICFDGVNIWVANDSDSSVSKF